MSDGYFNQFTRTSTPTQIIALEIALHPLDYVTSSMEIIRNETELQLFISKGNLNSAVELSNAGVDFQVATIVKDMLEIAIVIL